MEDEKSRPLIDLDSTPVVEEEDCDEDLDMSEANALTWLVKIPKFLAERWQKQAQLGQDRTEIGEMRVYDEEGSDGKRRIELILQDSAGLDPVPSTYKLDVRNANSMNLHVFDELAKPEPVASTSKPEPESNSFKKFDRPRRVRPKVVILSYPELLLMNARFRLSLMISIVQSCVLVSRRHLNLNARSRR